MTIYKKGYFWWIIKCYKFCREIILADCYVRNTPGSICRYKEDGLVSRPPCQGLYASSHAWHVMPKVSTQFYMLDRKIWKLFRPRGNGQKRTKCDQFFCPTSDFFDFCNPSFFYHTFTNDVEFVDKSLCRNMWPQFVYIAISLDWKINIYWDQCSQNKLATLVPSVLV